MMIGQYYHENSLLHQLDPRTKMIGLIVLMSVIFSVTTWWKYAILALLVLGLIHISSVPLMYYIRGLRVIIGIIVFTSLLNLFFSQGETVLWQWGFLTIYKESLLRIVWMIVRIVLLVCLSTLLTLTTKPMRLADGLEAFLSPLMRFGFPAQETAMMMMIALRFIPTLAEELDRIMKAQMARGAQIDASHFGQRIRNIIPLLIPLFISSMQKANDLAIAMDSRCYDSQVRRSKLYPLVFQRIDYISFGILIVIIIFAVI